MNLHLRIPPLVVTALAAGFGWVGAVAFPELRWEFPARGWLVATLFFLGVIVTVLGVASFRRAHTTVNPLQPERASALVISGIYRFSRNPMYLGFLLMLLSELAWLANPIALIAAPAYALYLNYFQIVPEERALTARFGTEYLVYADRVRRWI